MNSPCNEAGTSELTNVSIVSARQFAAAGWTGQCVGGTGAGPPPGPGCDSSN